MQHGMEYKADKWKTFMGLVKMCSINIAKNTIYEK